MSGEKSENKNKSANNNSTESFIMKPKIDFCFKELMADEEIRRGFISALLRVKPEEILHTELQPTHLRKERKEDKLGILDVRVQVHRKGQMDIEIQVTPFEMWPERSLFYLGKMYVEQIQAGKDYDTLQKCIHVGILDFILFPEDPEFYSRFHLWEDKRSLMYSDKLEIHIIELPKLKNKECPETELLKWARFLNAESKEEMQMAANTDPYITKAYEKLVNLSADDMKRLEYEAREKAIRDYNWQMKTNYRQGKRDGIEEGIKKGIKEGIKALAESILTLLDNKGVLPESVKKQVLEEQNMEQLKNWLQLAAKVDNTEAFIEGMKD